MAALDGIAFVAQDMPLYRHLSVADMLHLTRNLNRHFDTAFARRRLADLGIAGKLRAGKLSGGQQAQLALTLALARRPRLLVLDEPTASLDPLARHDFMATVMTAMADDGISVVLSSHVLAELERVADHLVLISHGCVRLAGAIDELLDRHRLVTGPPGPTDDWDVIDATGSGAQTHRLVRLPDAGAPLPSGCEARPVGIEELALGYLRETRQPAVTLAGADR
jgi:ABC-2 type transport system ATP-binding protein